jgi:hypothetical protein
MGGFFNFRMDDWGKWPLFSPQVSKSPWQDAKSQECSNCQTSKRIAAAFLNLSATSIAKQWPGAGSQKEIARSFKKSPFNVHDCAVPCHGFAEGRAIAVPEHAPF